MNTQTFAALTALNDLAGAGFKPCPLLPGDDDQPGWRLPGGRRAEFSPWFPNDAFDEMPAEAEALPGIVPDGDVVAVRTFGDAISHLPPTPFAYPVGDSIVSLYRAADDLSAAFGFDLPPRSFGWGSDDDGLYVIERAQAVSVPAGFLPVKAVDLPALTAGQLRAAYKAMGAAEITSIPFDPFAEIEAAEALRSEAIGCGKAPVLVPEEIEDPFADRRAERSAAIKAEHEAKIAEFHAFIAAQEAAEKAAKEAEIDACEFEAIAFVRAGNYDAAAEIMVSEVWERDPARRDRVLAKINGIIAEAAQRAAESRKAAQGQNGSPVVQPAPTALADLLDGDAFDLPDDDSAIKPIAFLMGKDFARGFLTATIAPGGVGKSVLSLVEALSLATGRDLLSHDPRSAGAVKERVPVLLLSLEDSPDIVRMRLTAICRFYGITKDEIGDRLRVRCGVELPAGLIVAETTRNGTEIKRPVIDALVAVVKRRGYGKVTVDPFVSSHAISENDNTAMQRAAEAWREVAHKGECSVELIHHARKLNGERVTAEDARGGSALIAACRFTRTLSPMDEDTAGHFRMSVRDAMGLVGIFRDGKQNLVQRQAGAQWFKLTEQALYNGPGGAPESTVGVPAYWSAKAQAQAEPLDVALIVKALIGQPHAHDPRSPRWIGHVIARALSKDVTEDRPLIKGWIDDLVSDELIALDTVEDQHRKKRKVYVVTAHAIRQFAGDGATPWGEPVGRPAASTYGDDEGSDCPF